MCIRDRKKEGVMIPITSKAKFDKAKFFNKVAEDQLKRQNKYQRAVSYTHLDVYKRQH